MVLCGIIWSNINFRGLKKIGRITDQMIPNVHGPHYTVRSMVHIRNMAPLKVIYFAYFHSTIKNGIIIWGIRPTVERYVLCKRKLLRLKLAQNLEIHVDVH
jgi:hypothetical protein